MAKKKPRLQKKIPIPKSSPNSLKGSKDASSVPVQALFLAPDGKPYKKSVGKLGIYAIKKGKKITRIEMEPQKFSKRDLKDLSALLEKVSYIKTVEEMRLPFFQVNTAIQAVDKKGAKQFLVPKKGKNRGKKVPILATKIKFKLPKKGTAWRQPLYKGGAFDKFAHPYIQERSPYEAIKAEVLNEIGFSNFTDAKPYLVGAVKTEWMQLKGKTITSALRNFQPPVTSKWLHDNKINTIKVTANVQSIRGGVEGEKFSVEISVPYLSFIPTTLGSAIRQHLANQGSMFYSAKVLAKIYNDALKKYKNSKGGTKTEKARRELQRLARPGLNAPFNKNYDASLKKIFKNKMKASDFHLKKVDKVFINLEYRFLNQPGATKTKTKGTKK